MLSTVLIACYGVLLVVISVYGVHRYWMVWRFLRAGPRSANPEPAGRFTELPRVTVQLPMFNERNVAERVIEAACRMDWPRDRLEVQVLDDSTDESGEIAQACCRRMREAGVDVRYIHRDDRSGFKAAALANGLDSARGEFVAVFDADFVPPVDFLRRTIDHFRDESVGMVQCRWSHINRDESILTQVQALFLDGHFGIEQTARASSGRWFNFNGTAGIWRRSCIDEAGGWKHDTLTEDTDLSYRAQLCGWRFVYLPNVRCPAEIPPTVSAFLSQQHRWNKGLIETAVKLLPTILRSRASLKHKIEAWFHLTAPSLYVAVLLICMLLPVSLIVCSTQLAGGGQTPGVLGWENAIVQWAGLLCLVLGTSAAATFYVVAQVAEKQSIMLALVRVPLLMAVGVGTSAANTAAVVAAILRRRSAFIRTPKFNQSSTSEVDPIAAAARRRIRPGLVELGLALILAASLIAGVSQPMLLVGAPFVVLFLAGFTWIGLARLWESHPVAPATAAQNTRSLGDAATDPVAG